MSKFISRNVRMQVLKMLEFIPDSFMIKVQYKLKTGLSLNLKNPQRYSEKIQWYKLYYRDPIMTQCVDKYGVREYIKKQGYENLLTKLYGVYDNPDQIDFDSLPDRFIMKTTNGSQSNVICLDKNKLDLKDARNKMKEYMRRPQKSPGREWAYDNVKNRIVIEELLINQDNPDESINDYKFLCFNGSVYCIIVDMNRFTHHCRCIYDTKWNELHFKADDAERGKLIECPEKLQEMIKIAESLAKRFPSVRVDLYYVNDHIYFGELTFYPWSGYVRFEPDETDFKLGELFTLREYYKK